MHLDLVQKKEEEKKKIRSPTCSPNVFERMRWAPGEATVLLVLRDVL